jgi:shikimate kinase
MKSRARAHGAATIIAAFATGKGAALGVDLGKTVEVELFEGEKIMSPKNPRLPDYCVLRVLKHFGLKCGFCVRELSDDIPHAVGLKSSSTVANATVLAAAAAASKISGKKMPADLALVDLGVDAAFDAKVTVTGAFDDATASFFGGVCITDNLKRRLVKRTPLEDLTVVVLVPEGRTLSGSVDVQKLKKMAEEIGFAWKRASEGRIHEALTINGVMHALAFGHDPAPALAALSAGALSAGLSGTGPATVALCRREGVGAVKSAFSAFDGGIITAETTNEKSRVL